MTIVTKYKYKFDLNFSVAGALKHGDRMSMIALTPYTAFMVGGYTTSDSRKNINYWVYNPERTRFEKPLRFLQHRQNWNYWTVVRKGYKALANCEAERSYAAVGWGGTNQHTEWSVMLRARWQSNTDTRPVCSTLIGRG